MNNLVLEDFKDLIRLYDEFAISFVQKLGMIYDNIKDLESETKDSLNIDFTNDDVYEFVRVAQRAQITYEGPSGIISEALNKIRLAAFRSQSMRIHNDIEIEQRGQRKSPESKILQQLGNLTPQQREQLIKTLSGIK